MNLAPSTVNPSNAMTTSFITPKTAPPTGVFSIRKAKRICSEMPQITTRQAMFLRSTLMSQAANANRKSPSTERSRSSNGVSSAPCGTLIWALA